jgi:hypothetical protein
MSAVLLIYYAQEPVMCAGGMYTCNSGVARSP